jgi:RNA polymerase sigma-70 factor (ECF subfamily)
MKGNLFMASLAGVSLATTHLECQGDTLSLLSSEYVSSNEAARPECVPATIKGEESHVDRELEIELARRLLAGEEGAFERFVEYSWLMCGQREDAEEVAQETMLKTFESFQQLRDPERVRPWVFRIAKNVCLTKRRKSIFAPTPAQEISLDELMPTRDSRDGTMKLEIADWSNVPEDRLLRTELKTELEAAIRKLPEIYRSVILLRDLEELSTTDTAQILDVTEDVVKTRLHRARLAVRKQLDERLRTVKREVTF